MFSLSDNQTRGLSGVFLLLSLICLGACEARLDLSGVEKTETQAAMRYDQFLSGAENGETMVVVGNRGVILTSQDEGRSWRRQSLAGNKTVTPPVLIDVAVCPDQHFVALDADRKVWSADHEAGQWHSRKISTEEEVVDLACDAAGNYWVVGSFSLILKSSDRGASWQDLSIGEDVMLSRIQFVSPRMAVITGEFGMVYVSEDGGTNWTSRGPVPNEFYSAASYFRSAETGWVGGLQGLILQTEDGGRTWRRLPTETVSPIYNIFEVERSLYALGDQGTILTLAGDHWRKIDVPDLGFGYLRAAVPAGKGRFAVAGGNGLIRLVP